MRRSGPGVGWFIALAVVGSTGAVVLAAWLGNWGGVNSGHESPRPEHVVSLSFTHDGVHVTDVASSLTATEEVWAQTHDDWIETGAAVATSTTSDSRCYVQVWQSGAMADIGLCGPYVRADGDDPEWASVGWHYETLVDGTVRISPRYFQERMDPTLFLAPSTHDEIDASGQALLYKDTDLVGADGRITDRDLAVTPPMGWPRTLSVEDQVPVRDLVWMPREQIVSSGGIAASGVVQLYGHDYRVEVDSVARLRISDEEIYVPAPGGGIVVFRITPAESGDRAARKALAYATGLSETDAGRITAEVRSGDETLTAQYSEWLPLASDRNFQPSILPPTAMVVVPQLEGATYAVVLNGRRQPLEASS